MTMFLDKNVPMISMEMRPYRKRLILGTMLVAMITGFAAQNAGAGPIDWDKAQELREGVKLLACGVMSNHFHVTDPDHPTSPRQKYALPLPAPGLVFA